MKINKSGNVYRLATYFDNYIKDFCCMCRAIILNTLILIALCTAAGLFLGDLGASLASWIVTGVFIFTPSFLIISFIAAFAVLLLIILSPILLFSDNILKLESVEVVKEYYKSKKYKFCPTIELN